MADKNRPPPLRSGSGAPARALPAAPEEDSEDEVVLPAPSKEERARTSALHKTVRSLPNSAADSGSASSHPSERIT